jgi:putative flippase GtrA
VILTRFEADAIPRIFSRFPNIDLRVVGPDRIPTNDFPVTGAESMARAVEESRTDICVVMDPAHPADKIQELVEAIEDGVAVAVGTRNRTPFLTRPLTSARDPGSGFYAFRRSAGSGPLLDLLAGTGSVAQIPVDSALPGQDPSLGDIARLYRGRNAWPFRVAKFFTTGATGLAIHLAVLRTLVEGPGWRPEVAAIPAFVVAMSWNYTINRLWTFRARKIPIAGSYVRYATGAVAGLGVQIAVMRLLRHQVHYIAGTFCTFLTSHLWAFRTKKSLTGPCADSATRRRG